MTDKRFLTRDEILQKADLPTEDVYVEPWDAWVEVRGLTAAERDKFEQSIVERKGKSTQMNLQNVRAKLVALCVVDEQGNRLFTGADVEALGKKSAQALDKIFSVAQKLSGLTPEDVDELLGN